MIFLHVRVEILYVKYAKKNTLENVKLLFNIHLSNHRKDTTLEKLILTCKHSNEPSHNFLEYAKFNLIK